MILCSFMYQCICALLYSEYSDYMHAGYPVHIRSAIYFYLSSDGMSRSGVFITCMSEIERVKVEGGVDIFQTVKAARAQRPHMVYTTVRCC